MRRLLGWALNVAAASALLFVAPCVLWPLSDHRHYDLNGNFYAPSECDGIVDSGSLIYRRSVRLQPPPSPTAQWSRSRPAAHRRFAGFETFDGEYLELHLTGVGRELIHYRRVFAVRVPLWAVAAVFVVPTFLWCHRCLRHWARRRRAACGSCVACGYDPRATPGRCPECGAVPAGKAAT